LLLSVLLSPRRRRWPDNDFDRASDGDGDDHELHELRPGS
jgi:hypothetical protein